MYRGKTCAFIAAKMGDFICSAIIVKVANVNIQTTVVGTRGALTTREYSNIIHKIMCKIYNYTYSKMLKIIS